MFNRRTAMLKAGKRASFSALLIVTLLLSLISPVGVKPVSADPGKLMWSIVDTPSSDRNVIVSPSEVNVIAIGSDDRAFNAVDIPNGKVYRSVDGGVSWTLELSANLIAAGAGLPVWNLAVAPDDASFLVAVTADPTALDTGPRKVFISQNGGARWDDTNFPPPLEPPLGLNEFFSCVDISVTYSSVNRDIAIGTRDGVGGGRVFTMQAPGFSSWRNQNLPPADVVALKFSPTYPSDSRLAVVSSDIAAAVGTRLDLGDHDTANNATNWAFFFGYPVTIVGTTAAQIITADLELPSDFSGSDSNLRRFYVSTDAGVGQSGVYRIDDTVLFSIKPPTTAPTSGRISSIAHYGKYADGILLAGEVEADPITGMVYVWRTSNPMVTIGPPTWLKPDTYKSPTGGAVAVGGNYFANAQVAWSSDGTRAYCGTSSANPTVGGTGVLPGQWPFAWQTGVPFDESAFSVSPYSPNYEQLLALYSKSQDTDVGNIWNQLSLIDTQLSVAPFSTFFSDVAALEVPAAVGGEVLDYNILYLASINPLLVGGFDSIWRSTSDPLGRNWERVLCTATSNNGILLRIKQTAYDETTRSQVIVFADTNTNTVGTSLNEGQVWHIQPLVGVTDLALASDTVMYILNDRDVYRYKWATNNWLKTHEVHTDLSMGYSIAVPLKNPEAEGGGDEDWVIVGEVGPPGGMGTAVYADFSQLNVEFEPPISLRVVSPPIAGDAHVIADDKFEQNKTIYNATNDTTGANGKIYRWVIDKSTSWDELEPPNNAFYGLAQRNDVLYGAWNVPTPPTNPPGVDRTLYPRVDVPPPPEWDDLTVGLPVGGINFPVLFTRAPSSLKVSSNEYNNLWAIDDKPYDRLNGIGCLWGYTDTAAKAGPWTTAPASGDLISVDPVTGRADEINFAWKQLSYSSTYELQLAKDRDFYIRLLVNEDITPADPLAPECFFPAGGLVPVQGSGIANFGNLESGHIYYWRVRARAAVTGEVVRSPWSATMYFTVGAGLPVMAQYPTVTLFTPTCGARGVSRSPSFSWSLMPKTTKYEFILAKDAAFQQVIVKTNVPLTSYMFDGTLDYNTNYFWQVRAVEPIVSDPSAIGTFTVMAEKKPVEPAQEKPSPIPFWVWGVIAVCAVLVATMIAYAVVGSGYAKPKVARVIKIEPVASRAPSPTMANMAKMWGAISTKVRGWRFWRKRGGTGSDDKPESVE
jgi:hypothetical protein